MLLIGWLGAVGLPPSKSHAQTSMDLLGSAQSQALGAATTAYRADTGGHANPAAMAFQAQSSIQFFAREAYGLSDLRVGAAHVTIPVRPVGSVGTGASSFGSDDYRETYFNLGAARTFQLGGLQVLAVGFNARYYRTSIARYGSAGAMGFSAGLLVPIHTSIDIGIHATNLNAPSLASGVSLPRTIAAGLAYRVAEHATLLIDGFQDFDFPLSIRSGLEVVPVSFLALRAGVMTEPTRFTMGIGLQTGPLHANLAADQHEALGWSPSAGVRLFW